MERVDRLRLKVLNSSFFEVTGFNKMTDALAELLAELSPAEAQAVVEYAEAAQRFAEARTRVLDSLVKPHVRAMREQLT